MLKLWHDLKKSNLRRRSHPKKEVVKVEEGEVDGNEDSNKNKRIAM
jgi:hypothetical protein